MALYVEEPLSGAARTALIRSREAGDDLHAPDLLLIECANALWKRVRRGELDRGVVLSGDSRFVERAAQAGLPVVAVAAG